MKTNLSKFEVINNQQLAEVKGGKWATSVASLVWKIGVSAYKHRGDIQKGFNKGFNNGR